MSGHYMPLTWLTHGLDYVLWGMRPTGYHAVNVLLHAFAAVAAYVVALRVLAAAVGPEPRAACRFAAAVAALLFAVHPLRVESVAWITERRDVLCGVFLLLAIVCYLRAVEDGGPPRARWYWTAVALAALALLSKAMAVTLPLVLLLLDVYPLRRIGPSRWTRREVWLEKLPFVVLSVAASVAGHLVAPLLVHLSASPRAGAFAAQSPRADSGSIRWNRQRMKPLSRSKPEKTPTRAGIVHRQGRRTWAGGAATCYLLRPNTCNILCRT